MYETHFGLKKRPFRAHARGNDVFIGPQSATTIAGIKKGLAVPDGIVAVAGPIGSGKTTLAHRALEGVGAKRVVVTVGRISLDHDEVLELLLEGLGVQDLPPGTVQRFTLFRRKLEKLAKDGTRVLVVVEDAARIGVEALSELESLTASDTGASEGAGVVLMGEADLANILGTPALGRLRQRLRLRQAVAPLKPAEMLAYFKHCFRLVGGEFDALFAAGSAELLHALSAGIPRIANNLVESALTAAAERKAQQVTVEVIRRVARDEYGLTADEISTEAPAPEPAATPAAEKPSRSAAPPAPTQAAPAEAPPEAPDTPPASEQSSASAAVPAPPEAAPAEAPPAEEPQAGDDFDIPELIQDTLPELQILPPQPAMAPAASGRAGKPSGKSARAAAARVKTTPEPPTLRPPGADAASARAADAPPPGLAADEIPAWDRDPTLAELRPDLEALEHAMALAHAGSTEAPKPEPEPELERHAEVKSAPAKPSGVPEITLDKQIQAKIEEAAEAIKKTEARAAAKAAADAEADRSLDLAATSEHKAIELPSKPAARPAVDPEPAKPAAQPEKPTAGVTMPETTEVEAEPAAAPEAEEPDEEFRQIAANLARAKTIDDVDDKMAETLFGEQFSAIAAQVAAKAAAHLSANDDVGGEANAQPEAAPKPKRNGASPPQGNGKPPRLPEAPGLDESASRRLATVRALNNGERTPNPVPNAVAAAKTAESAERTPARPTPAAAEQPRSIEEQINTSMTQTLQALSVKRPVAADDDDDDDKDDDDEKGGFFSRFRKS